MSMKSSTFAFLGALRPVQLFDKCYDNQFCLKFIHNTLLRYLSVVQNASWKMTACFLQEENACVQPPSLSLIFTICLNWSQLLIFSSSVIRDVCTEGKWTITWCVAAYRSLLLSDVTKKPAFISAYCRRVFVLCAYARTCALCAQA